MKVITRALSVLATLVVGVSLLALAPPSAAATATTTGVTSSANPSLVGQPVTLTVGVLGDAPTGSVTFDEPGFIMSSVPLTGGVATLEVGVWTAGTHVVTATYPGDANNDASTTSLTQTVVQPAPPVKPVDPPMVKLKVSSTKVAVGAKVRLSWRSKRADTVKASGDWRGTQKAKGSVQVRIAERGENVFKLKVANASGRDTATVKVMGFRKAKELELVVTEELVTVGTKVDITADGLAKGEGYTIRLNGKPILTGKADKRGDVARDFVLPKTTPEGELPLTITGSNPDRVGEAVLNVIKPKTLDIQVASAEIAARTKQTITVTGLLPGEEVTVTYAGHKLVTGHADEAGLFTYTFNVGKKENGQGDRRTVSVVGAISLPTRSGKTTFTILPGRAPGDGG